MRADMKGEGYQHEDRHDGVEAINMRTGMRYGGYQHEDRYEGWRLPT